MNRKIYKRNKIKHKKTMTFIRKKTRFTSHVVQYNVVN